MLRHWVRQRVCHSGGRAASGLWLCGILVLRGITTALWGYAVRMVTCSRRNRRPHLQRAILQARRMKGLWSSSDEQFCAPIEVAVACDNCSFRLADTTRR